ncbi:hypothetical protein EYF80_033487 [Liparis tanakae]|uniref:Uncharacterized protein n=1 Tax=Liparis tanakae TaxID=230148 RepID=A0A4Z2GSJ6_9TELE|nr:hypothetical protein EYF80_033487 [Liparis tanakae]
MHQVVLHAGVAGLKAVLLRPADSTQSPQRPVEVRMVIHLLVGVFNGRRHHRAVVLVAAEAIVGGGQVVHGLAAVAVDTVAVVAVPLLQLHPNVDHQHRAADQHHQDEEDAGAHGGPGESAVVALLAFDIFMFRRGVSPIRSVHHRLTPGYFRWDLKTRQDTGRVEAGVSHRALAEVASFRVVGATPAIEARPVCAARVAYDLPALAAGEVPEGVVSGPAEDGAAVAVVVLVAQEAPKRKRIGLVKLSALVSGTWKELEPRTGVTAPP